MTLLLRLDLGCRSRERAIAANAHPSQSTTVIADAHELPALRPTEMNHRASLRNLLRQARRRIKSPANPPESGETQ